MFCLPRFSLLPVVTSLLALSLSACQRGQSQSTSLAPLPQDPLIQVYTNHNPASEYQEPYRQQIRPGDNLEQIIIDSISQAQTSIDLAVQELRLPGVAAALSQRQKAGVQVRVILENTYSRPFSSFTTAEIARLPAREQSRYNEARRLIDLDQNGQLSQVEINQRDALIMLDQARIPRIDDTADGSDGSNLMHHKFVVIDNQTVIVTSANFTTSDMHGDFSSPSSRGNANNLLKIESPELAAQFQREFDLMWGDGPGGKPDSLFGVKKPYRPAQTVQIGTTPVIVQFSPTSRRVPWSRSSNGTISKTLSTASQSIDLALFVFSDQQLVNGLEDTHQRGVAIRALIDPGFAYRSYSEALDMLGVALAGEDCQLEPDNRLWQPPLTSVGVPRMPPGDLLHHKFGLIDGRTVITGSHNWTDAANTGNDETVLIISNPTVAAHYQREFERLYANAILGVPPAIRKKATPQPQCSSKRQSSQIRLSPKPSKSPSHRQSSPSAQRSTQAVVQPPINVNTASQAELEALPGVGPSLAKRIQIARQQRPLRSLADLDQIPGVGPKLLRQLQSTVVF